MKIQYSLKKTIMCLACMMPLQVYAASIVTELTWNDVNGTHTSTSGDGATNTDTDISYASTLVSFKAGGVLYNNFTLVSTTTASGASNVTPYWGQDATDLTAADDQLAVTDNRLDTGMVNVANNSDFFFASAPVNLGDQLFIFEGGSNDGNRSVELIDSLGNVVGSSFTVNFTATTVADFDWERIPATAASHSSNNTPYRGVTLSLSDLGVTNAGDLSSIAGVRLDGGGRLDPTLIGLAVVPEPSSALLVGLGCGFFAIRRRR